MMDTASNNLLKEIITDEDGKELLEVTVDSGKLTPPKAMDSNDLKLVNAFISNINMQEFYKEKSVVVDLNTLGKEVVDYHVGKNVIKKISNSAVSWLNTTSHMKKLEVKYTSTYLIILSLRKMLKDLMPLLNSVKS